ncbi:MAG: Gfo/Idh/MocA family protein [Candidatus Bipolaricaulia bacterium]
MTPTPSRKRPKPVQVGIIGVGGVAQESHIPGYLAVDGVELYAVCDLIEERAQKVARQFNIPHVFTDYRDLVALKGLDAVSVCTPNNFHCGPTVAALEADLHVLCEKPMAGNAEDGAAMVEAARKNKRILQIGLHVRFQSDIQVLKRFIDAGELGKVYYGRVVALRRRGIPSWGTFISKAASGGGPLLDIGVHVLDVAMWLIGYPKPTTVSGMTMTAFGNRKGIVNPWGEWDVAKFDVEDFATAQIYLDNGAVLTLETSWAANVDDPGPRLLLFGDEGGARLMPLTIYQQRHGALVNVTPDIPPQREDPHTTEITAFVEAIRDGKPSPVPAEESLVLARIFDAIYQSSETGEMIKF